MATSISIAPSPVAPGAAAGLLGKTLSVNLNADTAFIQVSGVVGPGFTVGETVTDGLSGATGTVVSYAAGVLNVSGITGGDFTLSGTVTGGTSGTIATIDLVGYGETEIDLLGGSTFQLTNITIMNPSTNITTATDGNTYSGLGGNGLLFQSNVFAQENLQILVNPDNYIDTFSGTYPHTQCWPPPCNGQVILANDKVYFSVGTRQGAPATVDIYVYGYVIS